MVVAGETLEEPLNPIEVDNSHFIPTKFYCVVDEKQSLPCEFYISCSSVHSLIRVRRAKRQWEGRMLTRNQRPWVSPNLHNHSLNFRQCHWPFTYAMAFVLETSLPKFIDYDQ